MQNLLKKFSQLLAIAIFGLILVGCQSTAKDGKPLTQEQIIQKRQATIEMAKTGLDALIKQNPKVKEEIEKAPGYAVFSATNINVVLIVIARGEGVLYDKRRKEPVLSLIHI